MYLACVSGCPQGLGNPPRNVFRRLDCSASGYSTGSVPQQLSDTTCTVATMYAVALTTMACLRASTKVAIAWIVRGEGFADRDPADAIAITPGGGRAGSLLGGALDNAVADVVGRGVSTGRVHPLTVSPVDALIAGLPAGGSVFCVVSPASLLPPDLWPLLLDRAPVCLVSNLDGDGVVSHDLYTAANLDDAPPDVRQLFGTAASAIRVDGDRIISMFRPIPTMVIAGRGPIADALVPAAQLLGWRAVQAPEPDNAVAMVTSLSVVDHVVVIQHDVEAAGRVLAAALASKVGYIGALGAPRMQQLRAEWLAYRGITDLDRVHGPAGLAIGAISAPEVAVAILAEALATTRT